MLCPVQGAVAREGDATLWETQRRGKASGLFCKQEEVPLCRCRALWRCKATRRSGRHGAVARPPSAATAQQPRRRRPGRCRHCPTADVLLHQVRCRVCCAVLHSVGWAFAVQCAAGSAFRCQCCLTADIMQLQARYAVLRPAVSLLCSALQGQPLGARAGQWRTSCSCTRAGCAVDLLTMNADGVGGAACIPASRVAP